MQKITKYVTIPALAPAVFFAAASLPVELLGCRNRGFIAALIALSAGVLGIAAAARALMGRVRGESNSSLWMVSALILAIPAFYIVVFAT